MTSTNRALANYYQTVTVFVSRVFSERINKVALSAGDDKRITFDDGIHKRAIGYGD